MIESSPLRQGSCTALTQGSTYQAEQTIWNGKGVVGICRQPSVFCHGLDVGTLTLICMKADFTATIWPNKYTL